MRERFLCTNGIEALEGVGRGKTYSALFPGCTLEKIDRADLEGSEVVTYSETVTKFESEYCFIIDSDSVHDLLHWFPIKKNTSYIISEEVERILINQPPINYRTGLDASEELSGKKVYRLPVTSGYKSLDVLSAIEVMAPDLLHIYGLDFESEENKPYAFNFSRDIRRHGSTNIVNGKMRFSRWIKEEEALMSRNWRMKIKSHGLFQPECWKED